MFINLKNGEVSVKTYRDASATVTDLEDMLCAIKNQTGEHLVIDADGVKEALEDGDFLGSIKATQDAVEAIHNEL